MTLKSYTRLALLATLVSLSVVVLGAYVRLSHAGLSCPDWPGCYGRVTVPDSAHAVSEANRAYPHRTVDVERARKEMAHRYLAGSLGMIIVVLAWSAWRRRQMPGQLVSVPMLLAGLVVLQALLGMWTVTLLLQPFVVVAHLLGGLATTALLWWLALRQGRLLVVGSDLFHRDEARQVRPWVLLGLVVLFAQLALGGWTSANYAALACPDFPLCRGEAVPAFDLAGALSPQGGPGGSFEGGVLGSDARVTIHLLHRAGALVTLLYFSALALYLMRGTAGPAMSRVAATTLMLLLAQVCLGIGNVVFGLPLWIAVSHNAVAALLLLSVVSMYHIARPPGATL